MSEHNLTVEWNDTVDITFEGGGETITWVCASMRVTIADVGMRTENEELRKHANELIAKATAAVGAVARWCDKQNGDVKFHTALAFGKELTDLQDLLYQDEAPDEDEAPARGMVEMQTNGRLPF